ncbi:MAG: putative Ig domain-containing protein [Acidobacteriota bacterium]|nr:putative Ig domain-containing protein [Acidobacteriota bacterium]
MVSPTGTNPGGWLDPTNGFCAYHDNTGDYGSLVTGPNVSFTNLPYIPDINPADCSGLANPQLLDGLTEVASHEYAEVLTDPLPGGSTAWTDRRGHEIADKCQFVSPGSPGAAYYLTLATGTFDVQGLWANDSGKKGGCLDAHSPVLLSSPGKRLRGTVGTPVSVQIDALDVRGGPLTFTASGLPAGLVIDSATGTVTGTPTARGRSEVTVSATGGPGSASVGFRWSVRKA